MILLIENVVTRYYLVVVLQFLLVEVGKLCLVSVWYTVVSTIQVAAIASHRTCVIYSQNDSVGLGGLLALFAVLSTVCRKGIICLFEELELV